MDHALSLSLSPGSRARRFALRAGFLLLGAALALALPEAARADSLTIEGAQQSSTADNRYSTLKTATHSTSGPIASWSQTTDAHDNDASKDSRAKVVASLGQTGVDADFSFDAAHSQGNYYGYATSFGDYWIKPTEDLTYVLTGSLTKGGGPSTTFVAFNVQFIDEANTGSTTLVSFYGSHASSVTLSGSGLAGTLLSGHTYRLAFSYTLGAGNTYNGDAWGSGKLDLVLTGTASAVPEPGTLALFALGAGGVALARRRRTRR